MSLLVYLIRVKLINEDFFNSEMNEIQIAVKTIFFSLWAMETNHHNTETYALFFFERLLFLEYSQPIKKNLKNKNLTKEIFVLFFSREKYINEKITFKYRDICPQNIPISRSGST